MTKIDDKKKKLNIYAEFWRRANGTIGERLSVLPFLFIPLVIASILDIIGWI